MGYEIGFDQNHNRDIGYGVPSICDHPECDKGIDRGLDYICGSEPYGGEHGCGLFFCYEHRSYDDESESMLCDRCIGGDDHFEPKPDTDEWLNHKATHESWAEWRESQ